MELFLKQITWILKAVSEEQCTIVWLLVPWAQDLLDALDRKDLNLQDYQLSQWRLMHIGAQPVPPSLVKRWKSYFPNHAYDTNLWFKRINWIPVVCI